ncbi:MAG: MFS transporter, partial [Gemmatimonadetes bacterium]|nr:MFS transporter [Gemmatimonadota bacterium]
SALMDRFSWQAIVALATTVMVAFGAMFFGFSVFLTSDAAGADFTTTVLSLGYGGAALVGGLLAFPVGRYADRHGIRSVFAIGAALGFVGLLLFSFATEPWHVLAAWWMFIGPAGAMTYYEPAFIAVDQWYSREHRARALALLTVIGGISGTIFIPLTERLVTWFGWRGASVSLGALLLAAGWITAFVFVPAGAGDSRRGEVASFSVRSLLVDRRFVLYTIGMLLSFGTMQAIVTHRVARFEEAGFAVASVAVWAAIASALSLPGRYVSPFIAGRRTPTSVHAVGMVALTGALAVAVVVGADWQMGAHFILFGLSFGVMLPLRAMVMSSWYSGSAYGRIMGVQWSIAAVFGAAVPAGVGVLRDTTGSYEIPMGILVAAMGLAALTTWASGMKMLDVRSAATGSDGDRL